MVLKTKNVLDNTHLRPMADHMDIFHHVYREWNLEADRLTHVARESKVTWNSNAMGKGERIEAAKKFLR